MYTGENILNGSRGQACRLLTLTRVKTRWILFPSTKEWQKNQSKRRSRLLVVALKRRVWNGSKMSRFKFFFELFVRGRVKVIPGAIIGDGDRKSWDPRAPMIWDNFSAFRRNCAILTSYVRADLRTCRGLSRGCYAVAWSNGESCKILLQIFHSDGIE